MPILGIYASSMQPALNATSYESIATVTGTGSSGTITFSSIPSTYQHLQIRFIGKTVYNQISDSVVLVRFNSDTGSNYAYHRLLGTGSSTVAQGYATQTRVSPISITNGSATIANMMGVGIVDILDYASTSKYKTLKTFSGFDCNTNNVQEVKLGSGLWQSTSAITSISLTANDGNWATTTQFALYGIKG